MRNIERRELVRLAVALMAMPLAGCKPASPPYAQRTLFNFNTVCVLGGNVGEDGEVASRVTEYEDGAATFTIDGDGMLIWNDAKENAGDGMRFERGEMPESEAAPADQ